MIPSADDTAADLLDDDADVVAECFELALGVKLSRFVGVDPLQIGVLDLSYCTRMYSSNTYTASACLSWEFYNNNNKNINKHKKLTAAVYQLTNKKYAAG